MVHTMEANASLESTVVNNSSQEERRGVKRKISLTSCDTCESEEAKYRCPNCSKNSCSLPCVKQHKRLTGCSGVRDQTAFVPLAQFEEINLLNDYRFLEETARVADRPRRDALLLKPLRQDRWAAVRKSARAAKVELKLLPKSFTRHRENSTFYSRAERKLYWHLKLLFPKCSAVYTDRAREDRILENIVSGYIHPSESDPVKRQRLKVYVAAYPDQLCVFLKSEQRRPNSPKFLELDMKKSLQGNLMFKTVLEYPEVHVVLKEHRPEYLTCFPGRSGGVVRGNAPRGSLLAGDTSHLAPPTALEAPQDLEGPTHSEGKTQDTAADAELEEGEIRSGEEEEEDEDEHEHNGAGGAHENVPVETNSCRLHDVKEEEMEEDDCYAASEDQSVAIETNNQGSHADESVTEVNGQNVTMGTVRLPSSQDVNVVDGGGCHLADVDNLGESNVQSVEERPLLHSGCDGKDHHDQAGGVLMDENTVGVVTHGHALPHGSHGDGSKQAVGERTDPYQATGFALPVDEVSGCVLHPGGSVPGGVELAEPNQVTQSPISTEPSVAADNCSQGNSGTETLLSIHSPGSGKTGTVDIGDGPHFD